MEVITIPVLSDNYAYLVVDLATKQAAMVDPVEPEKLIERAEAEGYDIISILTTHSHWDHAGGNEKAVELLRAKGKQVEVYGGQNDGVPAVTKILKHQDTFNIGNLRVVTYWTPCHTPGHVLYHVTRPEEAESTATSGNQSRDAYHITNDAIPDSGVVFTGDTLFVAGCGRFNSGTPEQMYFALIDVISKLQEDTMLFVGHEYTQRNLKFASAVEPNNPQITRKVEWTNERRSAGKPTVPSTVAEETETNPFMRLSDENVVMYAADSSGSESLSEFAKSIPDTGSATRTLEIETLQALREAKNNFDTNLRKGK